MASVSFDMSGTIGSQMSLQPELRERIPSGR